MTHGPRLIRSWPSRCCRWRCRSRCSGSYTRRRWRERAIYGAGRVRADGRCARHAAQDRRGGPRRRRPHARVLPPPRAPAHRAARRGRSDRAGDRSPGTVSPVLDQFKPEELSGANTVTDRASDYDAIRPDVWTHLAFGRGYGSYQPVGHRILDSEILVRIVEMGVIGLVAFLLLGASVVATARPTIAARHPAGRPPALAGAAAAVVFLVLAALFDTMSLPAGAVHLPVLRRAGGRDRHRAGRGLLRRRLTSGQAPPPWAAGRSRGKLTWTIQADRLSPSSPESADPPPPQPTGPRSGRRAARAARNPRS